MAESTGLASHDVDSKKSLVELNAANDGLRRADGISGLCMLLCDSHGIVTGWDLIFLICK